MFCLLVSLSGLGLAGGGNPAPQLARTYLGAGFALNYPQGYTVRPFMGGGALGTPGRGDILTATLVPRPANTSALSPEAYARQFAPLNIQGAGDLLSFARLTLPGGRPGWLGTWKGTGDSLVGPLYLFPLDAKAQRWLTLSAATPEDWPLLDAVARSVRPRP